MPSLVLSVLSAKQMNHEETLVCKSTPIKLKPQFLQAKFKIRRWILLIVFPRLKKISYFSKKASILNREIIVEKTYFSPSCSLQTSFQTNSDNNIL